MKYLFLLVCVGYLFLRCDCFTWTKWTFLVFQVSQTLGSACSDALIVSSERDRLQRLSVLEEENASRARQTQVVQVKSQSRVSSRKRKVRKSKASHMCQTQKALIKRQTRDQRVTSHASHSPLTGDAAKMPVVLFYTPGCWVH